MSEIPYGCKKCDECNGSGKSVYSCCTGLPLTGIMRDVAICPKCKELLCEEDCEACEGAGYVKDEREFKIFSDLARNEKEFKEDKLNNFL
jgi:DnaJ-class molecular chaperone